MCPSSLRWRTRVLLALTTLAISGAIPATAASQRDSVVTVPLVVPPRVATLTVTSAVAGETATFRLGRRPGMTAELRSAGFQTRGDTLDAQAPATLAVGAEAGELRLEAHAGTPALRVRVEALARAEATVEGRVIVIRRLEAGGPLQVSSDGGATWRVIAP